MRSAIWQAALVALLGAGLWWVAGNVATNLPRLKMELRFAFLGDAASFELGDNWVGYRAGQPFLHAFLGGLGNTVQVALAGIALAALIGVVGALMRLSSNLPVRRLAWLYVETMRNTPLLLQLLFWQSLLIAALPPMRAAWKPLDDVFISNRGLTFPVPREQPAFLWAALALVVGIAAAAILRRSLARRGTPVGGWIWAAAALPALAVALLAGAPPEIDRPVLRGFNTQGGATLAPEFFTMLFGLALCHGAFAAESIRGGILGVPKGQWEAARALGLSRWRMMRMVVLPQALRIAVPPLTSNFLSLTKSSSLAVAIGYPDLLRVSTVAISETGRAVECIAIVLAVYLTMSLLTSAFMNWYNRRVALKGN